MNKVKSILKRFATGFLIGFAIIGAFTLFGVLTEGPTTQGFINTLRNGTLGGIAYALLALVINPFGGRTSSETKEDEIPRSEMNYMDGDQYDGFGDEETVDVTDVDVEKYDE